MAIRELEKPRATMCAHFDRGCSIYEQRPGSCRAFRCAWLINEELDEAWHPLMAGFFIWFDHATRRMIVETDPDAPDAWRREPYYARFKAWSDPRNYPQGLEPWGVIVRRVTDTTVVFPEAEIALGPERGAGILSGYELRNGRPTPFARWIDEV